MPKYFHFHLDAEDVTHHFDGEVQTVQCSFTKPNGEQCKNRVCIGQPYCWLHERIGHHLKISASKIPGAGLGLYAHNGKDNNEIVFKKGELICPYYGEVIDQNELISRYGSKTAPYGVEIQANQIYEDGALQRGIGSLINHFPKQKNCRFSVSKKKRINVIATKNIRNGEEIYTSYGRSYKMHERDVQTGTNQRKKTL